MHISDTKRFFLFFVFASSIFLISCEKDIAGKAEGTYTGTATIYPFGGPGTSQNFPGTSAEISKLSKTTIRIEMKSSGPSFTFTTEKTLRKDGSFGDGIQTIRGSNIMHGEEGKLSGDSFTFSFIQVDSSGTSLIHSFDGHRN